MKKKIVLIITKWCNLNCSYCYEKKYNEEIHFMSLQTFLCILGLFKDEDLDIELFWWEPLLNKEIINYLIDNYKKLNINKVSISTNGMMIDNKIIDFYIKHLWNINFIISLDGDKKSHDYSRVDKLWNWTYEKILKNIDKIDDKSYITTNFCITPYTSSRLYDGVISLYKLWLKKVKFIIIYEYSWKDKDIENLISNFKRIYKLNQLTDIDISFFSNILLNSYNECENDMRSKYRFNYNGDLIPCSLYLSEFYSQVNLKVWNINDTYFDTEESFNKNIDYFFKNVDKFRHISVCDYHSSLLYKKNKSKINGLICKIFSNAEK
jgi:sulfatase maturation enzyme AslB (radical SAM superfamily)